VLLYCGFAAACVSGGVVVLNGATGAPDAGCGLVCEVEPGNCGWGGGAAGATVASLVVAAVVFAEVVVAVVGVAILVPPLPRSSTATSSPPK